METPKAVLARLADGGPPAVEGQSNGRSAQWYVDGKRCGRPVPVTREEGE